MKYFFRKNRQIQAAILAVFCMALYSCSNDDNESMEDSSDSDSTTSQQSDPVTDLGLSVKWANCNLGANVPEEIGEYYAWGETSTKSEYTDLNYFDASYSRYRLSGNTKISGTSKDVAYLKLGKDWRMPTAAEIKELVNNCTWTKETLNGVNGVRGTASNGNSIFLPATGMFAGGKIEISSWGYYWSGTFHSDAQKTSTYASILMFYDNGKVSASNYFRFEGMAIRPVYIGSEYDGNNNNESGGSSTGGSSSSKHCTHCAGTGKCSKCGGDGYVLGDWDQEYHPCSSCNYGDKADDDERGKCTYCNGTGKK